MLLQAGLEARAAAARRAAMMEGGGTALTRLAVAMIREGETWPIEKTELKQRDGHIQARKDFLRLLATARIRFYDLGQGGLIRI